MADRPPWNDDELADLIAFLDGELDEQAAQEIEAKLGRDPRARAEAESLRRTWDLLDYLPKPEPSTDFTHRTLDRISALRPVSTTVQARRRRWRPVAVGVGWAAAVLVAAGAGYWGSRRAEPPEAPAAVASPNVDRQLLRDLRVVENKRLYEHVDDIEFVWALADPELFGDDS